MDASNYYRFKNGSLSEKRLDDYGRIYYEHCYKNASDDTKEKAIKAFEKQLEDE